MVGGGRGAALARAVTPVFRRCLVRVLPRHSSALSGRRLGLGSSEGRGRFPEVGLGNRYCFPKQPRGHVMYQRVTTRCVGSVCRGISCGPRRSSCSSTRGFLARFGGGYGGRALTLVSDHPRKHYITTYNSFKLIVGTCFSGVRSGNVDIVTTVLLISGRTLATQLEVGGAARKYARCIISICSPGMAGSGVEVVDRDGRSVGRCSLVSFVGMSCDLLG